MPALRERVDDIPVLALRFLSRAAARVGRETPALSSAAVDVLSSYAWPGNVRELENLMERLVILAPREQIEADDLPSVIHSGGAPRPFVAQPQPPSDQRLSDLEHARIVEVLNACNGNKKLAAEKLGIHRSTLYAKLARYR